MDGSTLLLSRRLIGVAIGIVAIAWPGITIAVLVGIFGLYAVMWSTHGQQCPFLARPLRERIIIGVCCSRERPMGRSSDVRAQNALHIDRSTSSMLCSAEKWLKCRGYYGRRLVLGLRRLRIAIACDVVSSVKAHDATMATVTLSSPACDAETDA
jgi:hypothetical protein